MIQTINKKITSKDIKNVLPHEHFVFGYPGYIEDNNSNYNRDIAYKNCCERIALIKKYDVNLVIDATTIECGRDPILLKKLSNDTEINIVCSTGFFKADEGSISYLNVLSYLLDLEKHLENLFLKELIIGIGETDCKAGAIKVASSLNEIKPLEETIFIAAAKAQIKTGVPILTHCDRGSMGLAQAKLLLSLGVNPKKIIIGHMSSNHNLEEIKAIMELGVYIAFDQFGIESIPNIPKDVQKIENLTFLLKQGYASQIVISHDNCFDRMGYVSKSKPRFPNIIFEVVIPKLLENGIAQNDIDLLINKNIIRILEGE